MRLKRSEMIAGLRKWLTAYWFVVTLVVMIVLIILIESTGISRSVSSPTILWIGGVLLILSLLVALWEPRRLYGRRVVSEKHIVQMIKQCATDGERLVLFRIISSPLKLHQDLSAVIRAQNGWDFVLYSIANPWSDLQRLAEQIDTLYLAQPVARTVFGIIEAGWSWQKDVIILTQLRSLFETMPDQSWLKTEVWFEAKKDILFAAESDWSHRDNRSSGESNRIWKVYESPKKAKGLFQKLQKELCQARTVTWAIWSQNEWRTIDIRSVRSSILGHLGARSTRMFRKFSRDGLRRWFRSADKMAIAVGFIGYMLSPFSPYNDLIVNVLPSFILASITVYFIDISLTTAMLVYYIGSNLLGIVLLLWAVKRLSIDFTARLSKLQKIAIVAYILGITLVMSLLDLEGAAKKIYQFLGQ
ncbi:MAG: hypothetical protein ONB37_16255 [candidate division KSB1 bacterium]|nr:hypothetical protein [candidate division KSB1 bacterium]